MKRQRNIQEGEVIYPESTDQIWTSVFSGLSFLSVGSPAYQGVVAPGYLTLLVTGAGQPQLFLCKPNYETFALTLGSIMSILGPSYAQGDHSEQMQAIEASDSLRK